MLKMLLMDLFPFLIDKSSLYNYVWQNVMSIEQYDAYSNDEEILNLLNKDLNIEEVKQEFLQKTKVSDESLKIVETYNKEFNQIAIKYFKQFKFNETIDKFFHDAILSGCNIILINNDINYECAIKLIKLPESVTLLNDEKNIEIDNLQEYLTDKGISLNEFVYFTNNTKKIEHLLEKGYFCATISKNSDNDNLIIINSIDDLNFGNLAMRFYDKSEDPGGEL